MSNLPSGTDADDDKDDPLLGSLVDGRYRVVSRIGDGGMGIVYKVEHTFLNKFFALKVMRPTRDTIDRQRFEQEARLASKIRHKNVVEISDFGVLPTGQPYFVMEFLRGHNLGDAIYEGRIDPLLACHIAAQIASGLQAVHKQNVVHRDLKPDNIFLIDPDSQEEDFAQEADSGEWSDAHFVKIMDFGIAKSIDKNLTGTGMTLGTPEYMSPEQTTGDKLDWRSDQYSLGCMLYEMLTGDLPFIGKGAFEVMNKHLSEPPKPLRQKRPELVNVISPSLEKLVMTMLAKKPAQRLQSMRAVEQALREAVHELRRAMPAAAATQNNKTLVTPPPAPTVENATLRVDGPTGEFVKAAPHEARDAGADDKTYPLLPALSQSEPPAPPALGPQAKTLVLGSSPLNLSQIPTPKRLQKLDVRGDEPHALATRRAAFFARIPLLRWLIRTFWRLLGRKN